MPLTHTLARLALLTGLLLSGSAAPTAALADDPPPVPSFSDGLHYGRPYNCGGGTVETSNSAQNLPIPDAEDNVAGDIPGVLTNTHYLSDYGPFLWSVAVSVTIEHDYNEDLDLYLISPAGTRITLSTDNGSFYDDGFNGTLFTDDAGATHPPGPVTLASFPGVGPLVRVAPEEPLSGLRGEDPNGPWTLEVHDDESGVTGTLVRWSLLLDVLEHEPVTTEPSDGDPVDSAIPDDGTPLTATLYFDSEPLAALAALELNLEIVHPRISDLVIELISPSGVTVTVANHQGGDNGGIYSDVWWQDSEVDGEALTDRVFTNGAAGYDLPPQEPLAAATGVNVGGGTGEWQVVVRDTVPGQAGTWDWAGLYAINMACTPALEVEVDLPDYARLDQLAPVQLEVENYGFATQGPVYLTATLPLEVSFHSLAAPDWTCGGVTPGAFGGTLTCSTPSLAADAFSVVWVYLNPPAAPQEAGSVAARADTFQDLGAYNDDSEDLEFYAHSANRNPWDVADAAYEPGGDSGGVGDGGQDAFDDWGQLALRVFDAGGDLVASLDTLDNFGLTYAPGQRWATTTPVLVDTLAISRDLYAPPGADWLRYVDTFTNTGGAARVVWVAWGGDLGSDNSTLVRGTSSGDLTLTAADTWAVTADEDQDATGDPPVGYALRSPADSTYQGPGIFDLTPFTITWPSTGEDLLGHVYRLSLAPGESASLAYFVYRGLAEDDDGPEDCDLYNDCQQPASGSEAALAESTVAALVAQPNFCHLTGAQFALIRNWPGMELVCPTALYLPLVMK